MRTPDHALRLPDRPPVTGMDHGARAGPRHLRPGDGRADRGSWAGRGGYAASPDRWRIPRTGIDPDRRRGNNRCWYCAAIDGGRCDHSSLIRALIDPVTPGPGALAHRRTCARLRATARALARTHGREWLKTAWQTVIAVGQGHCSVRARPRRRARPTPSRPGFDDKPAPTQRRIPDGPRTANRVRPMERRRPAARLPVAHQQPKGSRITSVLTAATQRTLVDPDCPWRPTASTAWYDMRRYLPNSAKGVLLAGNLAKSVRSSADMTDLRRDPTAPDSM